MACYHPMQGYRSAEVTKNGKRKIVFSPQKGYIDLPVKVACGQCIGCRLERSRQWAVRCMHEASMHMFNSFVTLTYDDDHLPEYNSLNYKHFQDFMKRLISIVLRMSFVRLRKRLTLCPRKFVIVSRMILVGSWNSLMTPQITKKR